MTAYDPDPVLDYQRLFVAAPSPCLVLNAHLVIVAVNEAYLAATATDRIALLGRPFPSFPHQVQHGANAGTILSRPLQAQEARPVAHPQTRPAAAATQGPAT